MRRGTGYILLSIAIFVVASRSFFWTAHPPNFDFANFALGVERFHPFEHHPHPPGYPLVILLGKAFAAAGVSVIRSLHLVSLLGSLLAVLGAYWLGRRLSDEPAGLLAAALLAVEPVFWYSGVSSPARVFLSAGVCWLLYSVMEVAGGRRAFLWVTAVLLALFAGFRPELALFFVLPGVIAARLGGFRWRTIAAAAAVCLAACAPWMLWIASTFPSAFHLLRTYYYYFLHHASTTSALLGAPQGAWQGMLWKSLYWNGISAILALLVFFLCRRAAVDSPFYRIAGAYFVPSIAVQLFVHLGADSPDHALGTITVLVMVAAALLAGTRWITCGVAAAAVWVVGITFAVPGQRGPELDILSLRSFAKNQRPVAETIQTLKGSLRTGDAILVSNDSAVSWRILQYEFPGHVVLALESTIRPESTEPPGGWRFLQRRQTPLLESQISLPQAQRLQIFAGQAGAQRKLIVERLCARANCQVQSTWLQADVRNRNEPLDLPPYRLSFR